MLPTVLQITTTPGTPKQISTTQSQCSALWVVNLSSEIVAFGNKDLNRSSGAGVIALVPALEAGATPDHNIIKVTALGSQENLCDLRDYWLDTASGGTAAVVNIIPFVL